MAEFMITAAARHLDRTKESDFYSVIIFVQIYSLVYS